jgi:hypothetical protein
VLVSARLASAEMDRIAAQQGERHGNQSETERTSVYVFTRQQLLEDRLVDYATLGQISRVNGD